MSIYRLKGASGPVINQTFPLTEKVLIGRADDCAIRLDDDAVASHHAELIHHADGVRLSNLAEQGTQVNGELVDSIELASGDEIRIGQCRLVLQAPGLRPKRVLTEEAIQPKSSSGWRWVLALAAVAAATAGAWYMGWIPADLFTTTNQP